MRFTLLTRAVVNNCYFLCNFIFVISAPLDFWIFFPWPFRFGIYISQIYWPFCFARGIREFFCAKQKPALTGSDKRLGKTRFRYLFICYGAFSSQLEHFWEWEWDWDWDLGLGFGFRCGMGMEMETVRVWGSAIGELTLTTKGKRHSGCCTGRRRYVVIVIITLMPTKHIQIITLSLAWILHLEKTVIDLYSNFG